MYQKWTLCLDLMGFVSNSVIRRWAIISVGPNRWFFLPDVKPRKSKHFPYFAEILSISRRFPDLVQTLYRPRENIFKRKTFKRFWDMVETQSIIQKPVRKAQFCKAILAGWLYFSQCPPVQKNTKTDLHFGIVFLHILWLVAFLAMFIFCDVTIVLFRKTMLRDKFSDYTFVYKTSNSALFT